MKIRSKSIMLIVCTIAISASAMAESIVVRGVVKSSGHGHLPIAGATIEVMGTDISTKSNKKGEFTLTGAPDKGALIFRFENTESVKKKIKEGKAYDITLDVYSYYDGDELVNIGYGKTTKGELTGAVTSLDYDDVNHRATSDFGSTLEGQVAGLSVMSGAGAPGEVAAIQIRGVNSIEAGGNPLYVVDGVPYNDDPGLSPSEVQSVDVLKDAASTSIYGTRGAGGVILITTKKGYETQQAEYEAKKAEKSAKKEKKRKK